MNPKDTDINSEYQQISRNPTDKMQKIVDYLNMKTVPLEENEKNLIDDILIVQKHSLPTNGQRINFGTKEDTVGSYLHSIKQYPEYNRDPTTSNAFISFCGTGHRFGDTPGNDRRGFSHFANQIKKHPDIKSILIDGVSRLGGGLRAKIGNAMTEFENQFTTAGKLNISTVTISGHSRGAIQAINLCHKLNKVYPELKINLLLADPVKGSYQLGRRDIYDSANLIPKNVANCTIFYATKVSTACFASMYDPTIPCLESLNTNIEVMEFKDTHHAIVNKHNEGLSKLEEFYKKP